MLARSSSALGQPVSTVEEAVRLILDMVRDEGDRAVRDLTEKLDGRGPGDLEVSRDAISAAYEQVPHAVIEALGLAADRAREFHQRSLPAGWFDEQKGYGEVINPVGRVGAYVPAGSAPLPSTAIMTIVPARVAGVAEVIAVTPAGGRAARPIRPSWWRPTSPASTAYSVSAARRPSPPWPTARRPSPAVDLLCGPGNVFVTAAKKMLFGEVGIDGLYGPTETLVVADGSANPTLCAADLLAQAEHDVMATPILITTSPDLADDVRRASLR